MKTIEETNELIRKLRGDSFEEKLLNLMKFNAGIFMPDGYLPFGEVTSVELNEKQEKEEGFHWIDGLQYLKEENEVRVWVSTYLSEKIYDTNIYHIPLELRTAVFNKAMNAIELTGTLHIYS